MGTVVHITRARAAAVVVERRALARGVPGDVARRMARIAQEMVRKRIASAAAVCAAFQPPARIETTRPASADPNRAGAAERAIPKETTMHMAPHDNRPPGERSRLTTWILRTLVLICIGTYAHLACTVRNAEDRIAAQRAYINCLREAAAGLRDAGECQPPAGPNGGAR